jgi:hypothetical protein
MADLRLGHKSAPIALPDLPRLVMGGSKPRRGGLGPVECRNGGILFIDGDPEFSMQSWEFWKEFRFVQLLHEFAKKLSHIVCFGQSSGVCRTVAVIWIILLQSRSAIPEVLINALRIVNT